VELKNMKVSEASGSGQFAPDDEVAALKLSWAIDGWMVVRGDGD
jgi:hypothetical protein